MQLLLDESVPENLRYHIAGHDVRTVRHMGWRGRLDVEILLLAEAEFDAILTCDQSIPNQQNLTRLDIRIIVLHGRTNRIESLLPLLPEAMGAVDDPRRGQVVHIFP